MFYGRIRYYLYVCIEMHGSIRKSIAFVNFPGKIVIWKLTREMVGAENEQKRFLNSPTAPSVCFSAIVLSFCGDQCQYNSGYATNLLVVRHFFFLARDSSFILLSARFHCFEIFRTKSIVRAKLLTTHRYFLCYFYLLHTTPRGIQSIWRNHDLVCNRRHYGNLRQQEVTIKYLISHLLISLSNQMAA